MKIACLLKHVRDTETRVKVIENGNKLEFISENWVINPYDEFAIEAALRIKEKNGAEVVSITLGNEDATKSLRQAMAMGTDRSILINEPSYEDFDPLSTAKILSKVLEKENFDLILGGKHGVGGDNQAVLSIISAIMNIPIVTVVVSLDIEGNKIRAKREIEGGFEIVNVEMPAIITCQKGLNEPRYPSLKGIMAAKKKEIKEYKLSELGIKEEDLKKGLKFLSYVEPPSRPQAKILSGEPKEVVKELVKLLHEEAKVI